MSVAKTANISPLDPAATDPLYRQIYDRFRDAIACGVLKPGGRIPSARALTNELGLARGTIEAAYSLLAAEGYIQPRGQAGTVVTPGLKLRMPVASMIPRATCPGCVSAKDMGTPGCTMRARHAATRHGPPLGIWPACIARRDRRVSPRIARDQLHATSDIRDIGIPTHDRADCACGAEGRG
jgi:DNA-binding transcriptional MocR family regulator